MPCKTDSTCIDSGLDEGDERNSAESIRDSDQDLEAPMQIDPRSVGVRKRVEIDVRYAVATQDPFAGFQMPPEIGVGHRKTHTKKRPQHQRNEQQMVPLPCAWFVLAYG